MDRGRLLLLAAAAAALIASATARLVAGGGDAALYSGICSASSSMISCNATILDPGVAVTGLDLCIGNDCSNMSLPVEPVLLDKPIYIHAACWAGSSCQATLYSGPTVIEAGQGGPLPEPRSGEVLILRVDHVHLEPGVAAAVLPPKGLACGGVGAALVSSNTPLSLKLVAGQDTVIYEHVGRVHVVPITPLNVCYTKLVLVSKAYTNVTIRWVSTGSIQVRLGGYDMRLPLLPSNTYSAAMEEARPSASPAITSSR